MRYGEPAGRGTLLYSNEPGKEPPRRGYPAKRLRKPPSAECHQTLWEGGERRSPIVRILASLPSSDNVHSSTGTRKIWTAPMDDPYAFQRRGRTRPPM